MRLNRGLLPGLASLALLPAIAQAQPGSNFNNSWFWGVNGGMLTYWTTNVAHAQAPSVGVEWMITKKHVALYIGFDQTFFKTTNVQFENVGLQFADSTLNQSTAGNREFSQTASIHDSRHIDLAFLGFPGSGPIRPYAGLGIAVNFVQNATIVGAYPNTSGIPSDNPEFWFPNYYGNQYLDQSSYWVSPLIMAGLQVQVSRISIFGQAKIYTTDDRHLFSDGAFFNIQAGVRYNVATIF